MAEGGGYTDVIGKVADAINTLGLPKLALAVAVVAGGLLWLPDKLLTKAKILPFRNAHEDWIALGFWLAAVFAVVCFGLWLWAWGLRLLRGHPSKRKYRKYILERIDKLTPDEASLVGEFVRKQTRTLELPSEHPTVVALLNARLIWRPQQMF